MSYAYEEGAAVHSGRAIGKRHMRGAPIGFARNRFEDGDEFTGVAFNTFMWNTIKDSGASVSLSVGAKSGKLLLTSTATTENDGATIQGGLNFALSGGGGGSTMGLYARAQVTDADEIDFFVGWATAVTTNPEDVLTRDNRIGFQVLDGSASIYCITESAGTETSTDSGVDFADGVARDFAIVASAASVEFYIDDVLVQTHTTNISTTAMGMTAMSVSGSASGTHETAIDYLKGHCTRD